MNADKTIKYARIGFAFLFGAVLLSYAAYGWYQDEIEDWQAITVGLIGFAFTFLPHKLEAVVSKGLARVFDLTVGRFFGNQGGKPTNN